MIAGGCSGIRYRNSPAKSEAETCCLWTKTKESMFEGLCTAAEIPRPTQDRYGGAVSLATASPIGCAGNCAR